MHELFAKDDGCLGRTLLFAACCFFTGCVEASPVYTVKQGDTLWGIAKAHKMSYKRLCELNNKPNGWSRIMIGEKIVVKDRFKYMFGIDDCPDGTGWKAELNAASVAQTNSFTETLWRFRKNFRNVRRENSSRLGKMWDACKESKNETDKICYFGWERMLAGGSLQRMSGDADVLTPILDALPHLKLAVPGRLDCNVSGGSIGAHSSFVVRQDESVASLSVELDGSVDSAWERLLLHIAGQQFYLGWHAGYEAYRIVTDVRRFPEEIDIDFAGERAWEEIGDDGRARMLKNDFEPKVSINDAVASVSYYVFSSFGGLFHVVDEVDMKTGKVRSKHAKFDNVVEYNCRVCY